MKIEPLKKGTKPTEWKTFTMSGVSNAFANAIRRAIVSEVKILAIDDVTYIENTSPLYDEILALRIGLVPLVTPDDMVTPDECDCNGAGCHKCTVMFTLKQEEPGFVYSGSLVSDHPEVKVAFDKIPLTYLAEGQKLEIECKAVLGTGKQHAKFQGALCTYDKKDDKKNNFEFYVESYGQKSVAKLVEEAATLIENKAKEFEAEL